MYVKHDQCATFTITVSTLLNENANTISLKIGHQNGILSTVSPYTSTAPHLVQTIQIKVLFINQRNFE